MLWTLPHPEAAIDEWIRVLRVGGRLVVVDSHLEAARDRRRPRTRARARSTAAVGDQLPFLGGRPREVIEKLLNAHGLVNVGSDPLLDLVAAQEQTHDRRGGEEPRPALRAGLRRLGRHHGSRPDLKTIRIITPTGHLGTTPLEKASFERGCAASPDFIVADSGSADIGPYPLGADRPACDEVWQRHDIEAMLLAARRLGFR